MQDAPLSATDNCARQQKANVAVYNEKKGRQINRESQLKIENRNMRSFIGQQAEGSRFELLQLLINRTLHIPRTQGSSFKDYCLNGTGQ